MARPSLLISFPWRTSLYAGLWLLAWQLACSACFAKESPPVDLQAKLAPGDTANVEVSLKMGGHLFVKDAEGRSIKLPMSAEGKLAFQQRLLTWNADPATAARDIRRYGVAEATLKSNAAASERTLPSEKRVVVVELDGSRIAANGLDDPLTREQADLIDTMGDLLAIDRLLPAGDAYHGVSWKHDDRVIAALLGLDNLAACDVNSEITGESHGQTQIRLHGTANGAIDGAATEIELDGAYLYHPKRGRITKFNLAVREKRKPGDASPGLESTAQLSLRILPEKDGEGGEETPPAWSEEEIARAAAVTTTELRQLQVDAPKRGFRFRHDAGWILTAEQSELLSLRLLLQGRLMAHCNVAALPSGSAAKSPTLGDFERDVRQSLGDKVEEVAAATEWKTSTGCQAFGVFANGKVDGAPIQWRYYLVTREGLSPVAISVTIEQELIADFADADRLIVDSIELLAQSSQAPSPPLKAAEKPPRKTRQRARR